MNKNHISEYFYHRRGILNGLLERAESMPEVNTGRWIAREEGWIIRELVRLSGAKVCYESGTANGYSSCWLSLSVPSDGAVHTFDPVDRWKVWTLPEIEPFKKNIHFHQQCFDEAIGEHLKNRPKEPVAFFIDGDHGSGAVGEEWNAIKEYLIPGDVIIFHDINITGVGRAFSRIEGRLNGSSYIIKLKTARDINAIYYKQKMVPAGDESFEPIIMRFDDQIKNPEKVRDTKWASSEKNWGQYPEKAMLSSSEAHLLYDAAKRLGPGNYANLGTYKGASAAYMALGLKQAGHAGKVYAVDDFAIKVLRNFPKQMEDHFVKLGIDKYLEVCVGQINEWPEKLKDIEFNFVFIDAGHTYQCALEDWMLWSPLVKVGGEVAFHDVEYSNIHKVIEEDIDYSKWKLIDHVWRIKNFRRMK